VTLQAAVYLPDASVHGPGPWPTLVSCYGGPHVQFVSNQWSLTADLRAQFLRAQGFLVLKVDNRGSHRRGLVFEQPLRKRMGTIEVEDQVGTFKGRQQPAPIFFPSIFVFFVEFANSLT